MSATWRNVANFCPNRANLVTWFLVCRHTFVSRFSDIDVPRTDEIRLSLLLIPTSNVDLHNRSPQQKAQKKHRLHPLAPRLHLLPHRRLTSLFIRLFVHLVGCWRHLSALVIATRPILSPRHFVALRLVSSSSSRRVSSRLVVVSRPLTHLVMPALFDCCVFVLHLVITALFCLVVPLVLSSLRHVASSCHRVVSCRVL